MVFLCKTLQGVNKNILFWWMNTFSLFENKQKCHKIRETSISRWFNSWPFFIHQLEVTNNNLWHRVTFLLTKTQNYQVEFGLKNLWCMEEKSTTTTTYSYMGVSKNMGFPSKSSILIGFLIINHPFWGTPIFWKHPHIPPQRNLEDQQNHLDNTSF